MSTTVISNHPTLPNDIVKSPPAPPNTIFPNPKPIAHHGLLVHGLAGGKSVVTIDGVKVRNLTLKKAPSVVAQAPGVDDPNSGELVMSGTIDLFGNKNLAAEFDVWHGPPPPGVTVGSTPPSVQKAFIKGTVKLSQLIPSLSGTSAGADLSLREVSIYHQNYLFDPTKDLGYNLDAVLVIDSSLGSLSSVLSKVLAIKDPEVHIHVSLGPDQSWNAPPNNNALTIEGSFGSHSYAVTPGVQITRIGVRLILSRGPDKVVTRNVEIFGSLDLTLPGGTVLPMELDYTLREAAGTVQLVANLPKGVTWKDPMGVQGFVLNPATFSSSLPLSDPWKGFKLDIVAVFQYQTTSVNFQGSYVPGGSFTIQAKIKEFDLASLQALYETVRHEPLKAPKVDLTIGSADLTIASGHGLTVKLTNVNIAGHGSANGNLTISSTGCVVHADLDTVSFGEVEVHSPSIDLNLSPKSSNATIRGIVKFKALDIDMDDIRVAVHLYPSAPGTVPKRTEWTLYVELTSSGNSLALSRIAPKLKGTEFDLALKDVLFIAASQKDPDVGDLITGAYKPTQGVQVFATLDEIPVFNSLTNSKVTGLVLSASWSRAAGFSLNIDLPVARNLNLGKGITTTPIKLSLDMITIDNVKSIPCLIVSAGISVPIAHSKEPLVFQMDLAATVVNATIVAGMHGDWKNPFGISDQLSIGPDLLLGATFNYVTGLEGVSFKGGMAIGDTIVRATVSVDEDPDKDMLDCEIDNLNFSDVVSFAEKLLHLKLPPPPKDFLDFQKIKVYICPVPLTVQGVPHPSGFSFASDMIVFGKRANVTCNTNNTSLSINGFVQDFEIGPLKVRGVDNAEKAVLEVQVSKDIQHLFIDGEVTLYAETVGLHLQVDTQPSPKVSFKTIFKFTELVTFTVHATLIGPINFKDLSKADFSFDADLEQHVLDYIHDELIEVFKNAKYAAEHDIDEAMKKVAAEQEALNKKIAQAQADLDAAQAKWNAHRTSVTEANMKTITEHDHQVQKLEDDIARAQSAYDNAKHKVDASLNNAQHDRAVKLQAAQNDLANAKRKAVSDINDAQREVDIAQAKMDHAFGSAESSIESAKHKVEGIQGQIDNINREIDGLKNESWFKRQAKKLELEAEKKALEVPLKGAVAALDIAEAVLKSTDYVAAKAALNVVQKTLELAKLAGPKLIGDAQVALDGVDKATKVVVDRATSAVQAVENATEKVAFDGAKATLAAYHRTNDALYEAAGKVIAGLDKSVEYIVFQTATTALATAKTATKGLDAAQAVLSAAKTGSKDVLEAGAKIIDAGTKVLNITSIHLSGSLGESVGGTGFAADIKGVIIGKKFSVSEKLHPGKAKEFFGAMVDKLKEEVKDIL